MTYSNDSIKKQEQRKRFPAGTRVRLVSGWRDIHNDHKVVDHLPLKDGEIYTIKRSDGAETYIDSINFVLEGSEHSGYRYTATWFEPVRDKITWDNIQPGDKLRIVDPKPIWAYRAGHALGDVMTFKTFDGISWTGSGEQVLITEEAKGNSMQSRFEIVQPKVATVVQRPVAEVVAEVVDSYLDKVREQLVDSILETLNSNYNLK